jgi:hypothetical protein
MKMQASMKSLAGVEGAGGRVQRGLTLDFKIQFGAIEHDDGGHPNPRHQADRRAERTIGRAIVVALIAEI